MVETKVTSQPAKSASSPNYSPAPPNFSPAPSGLFSPAPKYVPPPQPPRPNYHLGGGGGVSSGPNQNMTPANANYTPASGGAAQAPKPQVAGPSTTKQAEPLPGKVMTSKPVDTYKTFKIGDQTYSTNRNETKEQFVTRVQQQRQDEKAAAIRSQQNAGVQGAERQPIDQGNQISPIIDSEIEAQSSTETSSTDIRPEVAGLYPQGLGPRSTPETRLQQRVDDPLRMAGSVFQPENLLGLDTGLGLATNFLTGKSPKSQPNYPRQALERAERGRTERTEAARDILLGTGGDFSAKSLVRSALSKPEQTTLLVEGGTDVAIKGGVIVGATVLGAVGTPAASAVNLALIGGTTAAQAPRVFSGEASAPERLGFGLGVLGVGQSARGFLPGKGKTTAEFQRSSLDATPQAPFESVSGKDVKASYQEVGLPEGFKITTEGPAKGSVSITGSQSIYPVSPQSSNIVFNRPRGVVTTQQPDVFDITSLESIRFAAKKTTDLPREGVDPLDVKRFSMENPPVKAKGSVPFGELRSLVEKGTGPENVDADFTLSSIRSREGGVEKISDITGQTLRGRPSLRLTGKVTKPGESVSVDEAISFRVAKRTESTMPDLLSDTDLVIFGMKGRTGLAGEFAGDRPLSKTATTKAVAKPIGVLRPDRELPGDVIEPSGKLSDPFDFSMFKMDKAPPAKLLRRGPTVKGGQPSPKSVLKPMTLDLSAVRRPQPSISDSFDFDMDVNFRPPGSAKVFETQGRQPGTFFIPWAGRDSKVGSRLDSRTFQRPVQTTRQAQTTRSQLNTRPIFDMGLRGGTDTGVDLDIRQMEDVIQIQTQKQRQLITPIQTTRQRPPLVPRIRQRTRQPPGRFNFGLPSRKPSQNVLAVPKQRGFGLSNKYSPDLIARTFNIRRPVQRGSTYTGLELRAIPFGRQSRKKRRL